MPAYGAKGRLQRPFAAPPPEWLLFGLSAEIERIRETLENQGERFLRRVYTPGEQEFCGVHRDPVPHYAVRFAAKEALFKALGTGWAKGVRWQDVEVQRQKGEAPLLVLSGEAAKHAAALGASVIHLSLSHSKHSAVAVVILEKR